MSIKPPVLPTPPDAYSRPYMDQLLLTLRLFFGKQASVHDAKFAALNLNAESLPTQADYANLRVGDVYRDATAGNTLKVKV